jgi:hypothetical protein
MPEAQEIILRGWLVRVACCNILVPCHRRREMVVLVEDLDSSLTWIFMSSHRIGRKGSST